jgi:lysylphosphatidylglycerol synthetase-like protein (DUF2156 family)
MNAILVISVFIACLLLSLAGEAVPDILRYLFRADPDGKHSSAQRAGLYSAATLTVLIVIWAIYHATTEMNKPHPYP